MLSSHFRYQVGPSKMCGELALRRISIRLLVDLDPRSHAGLVSCSKGTRRLAPDHRLRDLRVVDDEERILVRRQVRPSNLGTGHLARHNRRCHNRELASRGSCQPRARPDIFDIVFRPDHNRYVHSRPNRESCYRVCVKSRACRANHGPQNQRVECHRIRHHTRHRNHNLLRRRQTTRGLEPLLCCNHSRYFPLLGQVLVHCCSHNPMLERIRHHSLIFRNRKIDCQIARQFQAAYFLDGHVNELVHTCHTRRCRRRDGRPGRLPSEKGQVRFAHQIVLLCSLRHTPIHYSHNRLSKLEHHSLSSRYHKMKAELRLSGHNRTNRCWNSLRS